jgi:beta-1,4-N-acetylglucosaminyltransferase
MNKNQEKILIAASAGGHLTESLQLSSIWKNKNHFFISDKRINAISLSKKEKVYFILPARRSYPKFIVSFLQSLYIILKERPSVIISTGAEIGYPSLLIGHYLGIKTIYIETLARINSPSLCGELSYGKVDHFYVQWKSSLKFFPKAKYVGSLIE